MYCEVYMFLTSFVETYLVIWWCVELVYYIDTMAPTQSLQSHNASLICNLDFKSSIKTLLNKKIGSNWLLSTTVYKEHGPLDISNIS